LGWGDVVHGDKIAGVLSEFARTMITDLPIQRILNHLDEPRLASEAETSQVGMVV
jgi:hypothetical protein